MHWYSDAVSSDILLVEDIFINIPGKFTHVSCFQRTLLSINRYDDVFICFECYIIAHLAAAKFTYVAT